MKLIVDLTGMQSQSRFRGIGRYTQGLIAGLARTAGQHEVWLAGSENFSEGLQAARAAFAGLIPDERIVSYRLLGQVQSGVTEHRWRRAASELVREHFLGSMGADAILFPTMFEGFNDDAVTSAGELCEPALRAVIAYDLIPLLNPSRYLSNPTVKAWYYAKLAAFHGCDLFLAISQSAATEVTGYLGVDEHRVVSIMGGADEFAAAAAAARDEHIDLDRRFGLNRPFFVYTASFDTRKNFEGLIAAFGRFSERARTAHQLALVTSDDAHVVKAISDLVKAAGINAADVVVTGQISDGELRALYRGSVALVHPSWHEGFGLPILEAMHLDTAVIGSNVTSIPEIIGLDEAMFDPTSVDDIADRMVKVAEDDAFRRRLKQNAAARRELFSWDKSASAAWRALETACANRRSGSGALTLATRYDTLISGLRRLGNHGLEPTPSERRALAVAIAQNIEVIDRLTADGTQHGLHGAGEGDKGKAGLSQGGMEMAPTKRAGDRQDPSKTAAPKDADDRHEQDFTRLRLERDELEKSLRASLEKVRALEGQLAAQAIEPATPAVQPEAPLAQVAAPAAPPPTPRPAPPAGRPLRRGLAHFAYRLVRPVVRPALWRLRGFIVAGVWEADPRAAPTAEALQTMNQRLLENQQWLLEINHRLFELQNAMASMNVRLDQDRGAAAELKRLPQEMEADMRRLSREMERALLSLAIGESNGLGGRAIDGRQM